MTTFLQGAERQETFGQFFTPPATARFLASMVPDMGPIVRLLDPGAGLGALTAAFAERVVNTEDCKVREINVVAIELDQHLVAPLRETLNACEEQCGLAGVEFSSSIVNEDFLTWAAQWTLSSSYSPAFNLCIQNPPYRKVRSVSNERAVMRGLGIETTNLYTAFISASLRLIEKSGSLISITPRSFCNGPYFTPFRRDLLSRSSLEKLHIFESRSGTFKDDAVLQENIVMHARVGERQSPTVTITSSESVDAVGGSAHRVPFREVVHPDDPDVFIHVKSDKADRTTAKQLGRLECTLKDLGLTVSTGRVVDFRAREFLLESPSEGTVPLIYPGHLHRGSVEWPRDNVRKPSSFLVTPASVDQTTPPGTYVLVKRFSAKEERRRIVAAVFDSLIVPGERVALENHLNYIHRHGEGIEKDLAWGLTVFLNSTIVDNYFRQFSGHTQVNATDLRKLRYPSEAALVALGKCVGQRLPTQNEIDSFVEPLTR